MFHRMTREFAPLVRLQNEMNRLFEGLFEDVPSARWRSLEFPPFNLWEEGDLAFIEAELPGIQLEDMDVFVAGNELTISGERKFHSPERGVWLRRERPIGKFSRTVTLPWEIDPGKVEAKLKDGILQVQLTKSEGARPRKIKVLTA